MINKKVTGIGCYAKPATLSRVFKKMVRNYTLGQFESTNLINGHDEVRGTEGTVLLKALIAGKAGYFPAPAEGTVLLKALIAGKTGYFPLPDSESCRVTEIRKITGFFLTLRNQRLNVSIFARGNRNIRERYTANLDAFTELRQKRLN